MADRILLIGSNNKDKARELRALLDDSPWDLRTLADFDPVQEPEETEDTFEGNALLKARYYARLFNLSCVADDSGLEVDALNGAPGVYSARYAGEDCTYADNNRKLLREMEHVMVEGRRKARFVCCAAFVDLDGHEHVERGTVEGTIAVTPRGGLGFGYDPVFLPKGSIYTFGELSPEEKAKMSHRGAAFRMLRDHLLSLT